MGVHGDGRAGRRVRAADRAQHPLHPGREPLLLARALEERGLDPGAGDALGEVGDEQGGHRVGGRRPALRSAVPEVERHLVVGVQAGGHDDVDAGAGRDPLDPADVPAQPDHGRVGDRGAPALAHRVQFRDRVREPGLLVPLGRVVQPDLLVEHEHVLVHERRPQARYVNRTPDRLDRRHAKTVTWLLYRPGDSLIRTPCWPGARIARHPRGRRQMEFAYDARTEELQERLLSFMDTHIYPAEKVFAEQVAEGAAADRGWERPPIIDELKAEARSRGLWNLFLTHHPEGAGLTNLQYAPLAEITGHSPALAPEALNCAAPDTGNMELLAEFGSESQQQRWLRPLLDGEIRSAFCMTEPDVASSDATNIATRLERDGDEYVINGRKWWSSGAMDPRCKILIVMGKSDLGADRQRQQAMILVPRETPGVNVKRGMHVFGYTDGPHGGHAEVEFRDVRVPSANLIAGEGDGFAIAQARLGPGRIHHCMRQIGAAERALELMCRRAIQRSAFGGPLADQGVIQDWIAESRVRIESARLLVLKTAWLMDTVGNKGAHTEIQAIKIATPAMTEWVLDKAIQTHGAGGISQDFPLAHLWASARTLRFADGPDEVHKRSLARRELKKYR